MIQPEALYADPNALAPDYARFDVAGRLWLTGHSHQAWPDRARAGQLRAWDDAARLGDAKWAAAAAAGDRVRAGFARLLGEPGAQIALGASTHELVVRWLSALPLRTRRRLVTSDGEFHSLRRQLDRLEEEGIEIVRVPASPAATLAERMAARIDGRTSAALVSAVLFANAHLVPGLDGLARACDAAGALLLVDAYHALNVVPWSELGSGLGRAYVTGGGYKYCQLGEGCCFLRLPPDCELRPAITGWYAEFEALELGARGPGVPYADGPGRFAGATYDPTSHYRGAEVFDFLAERGLEPGLLRQVSQHQVGLLAREVDALDADPELLARDVETALSRVGGFLALHSPRADELVALLGERGVRVDARGETLRLGPAPYHCDRQLRDAVAALGEALRALK